jgi:hypothetical protein
VVWFIKRTFELLIEGRTFERRYRRRCPERRTRNSADEVRASCVLPAQAIPAMVIQLLANDPEYRTEGNWEV